MSLKSKDNLMHDDRCKDKINIRLCFVIKTITFVQKVNILSEITSKRV